MSQKMSNISALAAVLALTFAVSLASGQETSVPAARDDSRYAELAKAPAKAALRHNPLEHDRDSVPAGAKLYDQHCAECHGELAEGGHKGPSLRVDVVQRAAPGTLFWVLSNGVVRRGMPVWSKLPEPQRWQIVSYLKSLNTAPPLPIPPPGPPPGH